jgi:hypothetical protein
MSSMIIRPHRRASGPGVWLALLALWVQALLPAIHHPGAAMPGTITSAIAGSLCMAPGSAPVSPRDRAPEHKLPPCPVCQTLQILGAGFAPPATVAIPIPRFAGLVADDFGPGTGLPGRFRSTAQARAPPFPI